MGNRTLEEVVAEAMGIPVAEVSDELSVDATHVWTSLAMAHLVVAVEDEYGVRLTASEVARMTSVHEVRMLLEEKEGGRA